MDASTLRGFLDTALEALEDELVDSGLAEREAAPLSDSSPAYEIKRAALAWARVDLTQLQRAWDAEETSVAPAEALASLRALLRGVPDPAAALLSAAEAAASAAAGAEEARAQLAACLAGSEAAAAEAAEGATAAARAETGALAAALAAAQEALRLERAARDAAEARAFHATESASSGRAAVHAELEAAQAEAEAAQQRAREAEHAAAKVLAAHAGGGGSAVQGAERLAELRSALALKERAAARLSQELQAAQRAASAAAEEAEQLRGELAAHPPAAEVARWRAVAESSPVELSRLQGAAEEAQRQLRQQLATEQAASSAAAAEAAAALRDAREALAQQRLLTARLETDLEQTTTLQSGGRAPAQAGEADAEGGSLLAVVVGQRERLKQRVTQLEEAEGRSAALLGAAQAASAAREAEVMRLTAQLRHSETFSSGSTAPSGQHVVEDGDGGGSLGSSLRKRATAAASRLGCLGGGRKQASAPSLLADEAGEHAVQRVSLLQGPGLSLTPRARAGAAAYIIALHIILLRSALS